MRGASVKRASEARRSGHAFRLARVVEDRVEPEVALACLTRPARPATRHCANAIRPSLRNCPMSFTSKVFETRVVKMADREETIVPGGRHLFPLLTKAFDGIRQIGVIGWSSQGPAQAQNLRESLEGTGIRVKVGLREGSSSMKEATAAGFTKQNGTLGEMYAVIGESD